MPQDSALRRFLLDRKLVAEDDLAALEAWPAYHGCKLAERLYRSGILSDGELCGVFVGLGATDGTSDLLQGLPPPAALGALSRTLAERHRAIALRVERSRLVIAMLDPSDTDAIEKLSWFCGLVVEPRAVRPRVLFRALSDAYGVQLVVPDAGFLAARGIFVEPPRTSGASDEGDVLPAPSADIPHRVYGAPPAEADPSESPLAKSVVEYAGAKPSSFDEPRSALALELLSDTAPARSPAILDDAALLKIAASLPPGTPMEARDSLPPQVLRLLVPPLRSAVLFLVRGTVAVGWDGRTPHLGRDAIRDVLLPLTAPSSFERAFAWRRVSLGNPADPAIVERILWRYLDMPPPSSFAVLPILVGDGPRALLYVDRDDGMLDDATVDAARRVGNTLADGLAPFVAAGTLFPGPPQLPPQIAAAQA